MWQACVAGISLQKMKKKNAQEFLSKTKHLIQKCNRSMHMLVIEA
jgi:hypothetical protein